MDHVDFIKAQWRAERPDLDVEPMGLLGRLNRLSAFAKREMGKTWARHGLNAASFDVLATLRRAGTPHSLSPGDLIAATMVTSGTMTNRIDQLVAAGLVARTGNPDDRRSVLISLTERGFETIEAALADHVETQRRLVTGLPRDDFEALDAILRGWLERIERD